MRVVCVAVLAGLLSGCGPKPAPPVPAVPVALIEARYDVVDAVVREWRGNVVLMDFWATWCGPCRDKFPHFVALHHKYHGQGLACVGVSLDARGRDERYDRDAVLAFLKSQDATCAHFVLKGYGDDEDKFARRFGLDGGIPHQALFGKGGNLVWHSEQKPLSEAELDALIALELAK